MWNQLKLKLFNWKCYQKKCSFNLIIKLGMTSVFNNKYAI